MTGWSIASASCARAGRKRFERVHHAGPALLARLAREAGVERFMHISAIGADSRSSSAYARTKAAGEQAVRDAFPTATILRPRWCSARRTSSSTALPRWRRSRRCMPLIGGGKTRFQPVYVGDVADAVIRCMEDAGDGRPYLRARRPEDLYPSRTSRADVAGDSPPAAVDRLAVRSRRVAGATDGDSCRTRR